MSTLENLVALRTGATPERLRQIAATRTDLVHGIRASEPTKGSEYFAHCQNTGAVVVTSGGQIRWVDDSAHRTYQKLRSREWAEIGNARESRKRHMRRRKGRTPCT